MSSAKKSLHSTKDKKHELVRYTTKSKLQAMDVLRKNNFNYLQTSNELGIARHTLKKWAINHNLELVKDTLDEKDDRNNETIEEKKDRFERVALDTKEEILRYLRNKVKGCRDVEKLAKALRSVHDVSTVKVVPQGETPADVDKGIDLMKQIQKQIKGN